MTPRPTTIPPPAHVIGIDGGGSGTRACLQTLDGRTLGRGSAGPSSLSQGVEQAWRHVEQAIDEAFEAAGLPRAARADCALGLGLAGAGRPAQREAFLQRDPGYACLVLESDARTLLLGAHGERAGIVVAAGTGSVGAARLPDGSIRVAGGWGFPIGDEGSGAWLGLCAVRQAQAALDGRAAAGPLARAVLAQVGPGAVDLQAWCARSGPRAYAALAPLVFDCAAGGDPLAWGLLQDAADELANLARALQPAAGPLPVVVGGSIGARLADRWPAALRAHCVAAIGDSVDGALLLARRALGLAAAGPVTGTLSAAEGG